MDCGSGWKSPSSPPRRRKSSFSASRENACDQANIGQSLRFLKNNRTGFEQGIYHIIRLVWTLFPIAVIDENRPAPGRLPRGDIPPPVPHHVRGRQVNFPP